MIKWILFSFIFLSAELLSTSYRPLLVISNVGQGQWVTQTNPDRCYHFDLGGERRPALAMLKHCRTLSNLISISHYDWDHISWIPKVRYLFDSVCLLNRPYSNISERKKHLLEKLKKCNKQPLSTRIPVFKIPHSTVSKNSNSQSQIYISKKTVLIPGDSPINEEYKWMHLIPQPELIKILILGHHGSRTSSSKNLLDHLKNLKVAIASARFKRYQHPHFEVVLRLKEKKTPVLKTEDWGHIALEL